MAVRRLPAALMSLFGFACVWFGARWSSGYIEKLSDHRGFELIAARDAVASPLPESFADRHVVLVVVDGLRADAARGMRSMQALREKGQCRRTDVGPLTVSRPVYATLSSGTEADRTGVRNNRNTSPAPVESVWQVAKEAGFSVTAVSHDQWWWQLFPDGFSAPLAVSEHDDVFAAGEVGQLALFHPVQVDEELHRFGADSDQTRAAVARTDAELSGLIARLDLARDTLIVTADHGHVSRGGHGGRQPEVAEVLTCFAGFGIRRAADESVFTTRTIAPLLSVLRGVRFPRHLRAGDDELDSIFEVVDPATLPAEYVADRQHAIVSVREQNLSFLAERYGEKGWNAMYERFADRPVTWQLELIVFFLLGLAFTHTRHRAFRITAVSIGVSVLAFIGLRGSFDGSAINQGDVFVRVAAGCSALGVIAGALAARVMKRGVAGWLRAQTVVVTVALAINLFHMGGYGRPLGFPLPPPPLFFLPFFAGIFLAVNGLALGAMAAAAALKKRDFTPPL